ncbi:flavin reductase family protein [Actinomadura graeca]|uniref:Flavin reductase family protein n=2 Tax=Actinomadura graeca TaxID=2750812 RepID=A0ABX8R7B1_9ACTN|nr:flavin reductase family protein [Actinomadura graeca]
MHTWRSVASDLDIHFSGAEGLMTFTTTMADSSVFRAVAGRFPSGVAVITAMSGSGPVGFTCQSFTSLSLDPVLISFNVARLSGTWPVIRAAGAFCVNVLAAEQAEIARTFAEAGVDRFAGVGFTCGPGNGAPRLAGAAAWLDATVEEVFGGGDHWIVVGRVSAAVPGDGDRALLFHLGSYSSTAQ